VSKASLTKKMGGDSVRKTIRGEGNRSDDFDRNLSLNVAMHHWKFVKAFQEKTRKRIPNKGERNLTCGDTAMEKGEKITAQRVGRNLLVLEELHANSEGRKPEISEDRVDQKRPNEGCQCAHLELNLGNL